MKKSILFVAATFTFSTTAFAANVDITTLTSLTFKPSANVKVFYGKDAGSQNYVVNAKHKSGDRTYSSSNNTSAIWYNTAVAAGTDLTATDGITTPGESTYSGWTSQ